MFTQQDYLNEAENAMSGIDIDPQHIADLLHRAIESTSSGTNIGSSLAYTMLGHLAFKVSSGLDGGYSGVGFYALALLHNPDNYEAKQSLIQAITDESPTKFADDRLLQHKLQ
jgi:hypothetical protein